MEYTIGEKELIDDIRYEVARVALTASTQGDNPQSAFDSIDIKSGDERTIKDFISDSIGNILVRFEDCAVLSTSVSQTDNEKSYKITFNLPDFNSSNTSRANDIITRYISLNSATSWFIKRNKESVEAFNEKANAEMSKLVTILRTRKRPSL